MLHPSYTELMTKVNDEKRKNGDEEIKSRYSIVIAAAKRARQIIDGQEVLVEVGEGVKPLSAAVKEIEYTKINIDN